MIINSLGLFFCGSFTPLDKGVPTILPYLPFHSSRLQCKLCERYGTVTMVTGNGHVLRSNNTRNGVYCPLMRFNFSGFTPMEFVFGSGWKVESVSCYTLALRMRV